MSRMRKRSHAGPIADVLDAVAARHRATEAGTAVVGFQVDDHLLAEGTSMPQSYRRQS